jgi:hypothetical protein
MIQVSEATVGKTYPVVVLVNGKGTANQASSEDRCVKSDEFPHGWVVVGKDLELSVEVQVKVDKASEGSGGVTGRHRLKAVVDFALITSADATVEHYLTVPICDVAIGATSFHTIIVGADGVENISRDDGLADGEEMRAKASNEPFDEDLENGCGDQSIEKSNGSVVDVPEAASTDLNNQKDGKGDEEGHESSSPNRDNLVAHRVGELRVHDFSILEDDGEAAARGWISEVYTQTDCAHESHGEDVDPSSLDP